MSGSSLDILESRIKSAVQQAKVLRAENARLKDRLEKVTGERDMLQKRVRHSGRRQELFKPALDLHVVRQRLQALLGRIDRLEEHLLARERE